MSPDLAIVYLTVLVVVGWVAGYFWLTERKEARELRARAAPQEADVLVNGGYHPPRVVLSAGRPIRLRFTRTNDGESWWDDLAFPYARVLRELAEGETATVEVGPLEPGEYAFFCAEGSMRGTLVVEGRERDQSD